MRLRLLGVLGLLLCGPCVYSQTAKLHEVRAEGMKALNEAQVVELTGLQVDTQVGKKELQDGADLLVSSGLFAKVSYSFKTHTDEVTVTFAVEENPRLAVSYDNFPWYADSELNEAIRKDLPFYDGTLPESGSVVERAGNSLAAFISAHGTTATVTHQVLVSPLAEKSLQQFSVEGISPKIASVDFSDVGLKENRAVQQHLPELVGKPYSRLAIDLFLAEAIRPIYQQQGFLKAKIGPAEVRLSGNPNQKLPEQIPVYVPTEPGAVYKWKGAEWSGNSALSTITLNNALGLKVGDVANGMAVEGGLDKVRDEYGHLGKLEVKLTPVATYDDAGHTVSYAIGVNEGPAFKYNAMTITGMSLAGEKMIREAWTQKAGDVFDKAMFEQLLTRLERHREVVFRDLPIHYDAVGHWLQTDVGKGTVDILLDFK